MKRVLVFIAIAGILLLLGLSVDRYLSTGSQSLSGYPPGEGQKTPPQPPPQPIAAATPPKPSALPAQPEAAIPPPKPIDLPVDRVLDQLNLGNIAFNVPTAMAMGKTENIQLVLSLDQAIEELKSNIQALGSKEGASVKISEQMEAALHGLAFDILPITPKQQAIASTGITAWEWQVVPKKEGTQWLYLSLTAHFEVNGKETMRSVKTFEKIIEVEVTPFEELTEFISDNWQWLWASFVAPVGYWVWKRINDKKSGLKEGK